jgi:hypothetical protein
MDQESSRSLTPMVWSRPAAGPAVPDDAFT